MKTDDPRLEEGQKKLLERIQKINDLILTVLKNHLILEQFMDDFLVASGEKYDDLTFAEKAERCEGLKSAAVEPSIWKVVKAANKLRNKIAHTLDQANVQTKMDKLRAAYLAALTPTQAKGAEDLDDVRIASGAFQLCGGYVVAATNAVQAAAAQAGKKK